MQYKVKRLVKKTCMLVNGKQRQRHPQEWSLVSEWQMWLGRQSPAPFHLWQWVCCILKRVGLWSSSHTHPYYMIWSFFSESARKEQLCFCVYSSSWKIISPQSPSLDCQLLSGHNFPILHYTRLTSTFINSCDLDPNTLLSLTMPPLPFFFFLLLFYVCFYASSYI